MNRFGILEELVRIRYRDALKARDEAQAELDAAAAELASFVTADQRDL